jgi:hypothetical protein
VSERDGNQINSRRDDAQPFKDLPGKKRKDNLSLKRQYASRNALSQMNYKDLEEEQDLQQEYGLEADEEDFEKIIMLQEDGESQFQQKALQLSRHKSAFEGVRLAESVSYISKSNQKPDLRKKKSPLAVNFREDLNVEANTPTLKTPQQDSRQLIEDDEFVIPLSQTLFDGPSCSEDKVESPVNAKDTGAINHGGYYKLDILNKKMES